MDYFFFIRCDIILRSLEIPRVDQCALPILYVAIFKKIWGSDIEINHPKTQVAILQGDKCILASCVSKTTCR